ncbi:hypothetical protein FQR65_LT00084 [Abscondita terminalis]|nr:hypothetical protein FQR65_LT00084 [Abscondita terminalis]
MIFRIATFALCVLLCRTLVVENYDLLHIMYTSGFILAYLKSLAITFKKNKVIKVFDTLESGIFLPDLHRGGEEEKQLMYDWITYLNKFCLLALPTAVLVVVFSFTFWKCTKYLQLPLGLFVKIINDEITAVIQCIWYILIGTGYLISDIGVLIVFSHIRLHLKNLQTCIDNLIFNSNNDACLKDIRIRKTEKIMGHSVEWKYLQKRLKQVISYHSAILDVSKLVDDAFSLCHLIIFICLSFHLCLLIYGMSRAGISDGLFWLQCMYLITLIMFMNIVNYFGNEIIIDSQNIANCCYNIEFVGTDLCLQKAIILIIQRSQRPILMTVGKFAPISVVTSLAVMRGAYSYFTVLYNRH